MSTAKNDKSKVGEESSIDFTENQIITTEEINNQQTKDKQKTKIQFPKIKKEVLLDPNIKLMTKNEIDELYSYETAICRIKLQNLENEEIIEGSGTGFFCEIDDNNTLNIIIFSQFEIF